MKRDAAKMRKIRNQISKLQDELRELENADVIFRNSKLVGMCFKRENSYSSGKRWWQYLKVVGQKDGDLKVVSFQEDCYWKMDIETYCSASANSFWFASPDSVEITEGEFNEAKRKFLEKVCTVLD